MVLVNSEYRLIDQSCHVSDNRRYGSTNMNERSSRSHTIFRVIIESREAQQDGAIMVSHLVSSIVWWSFRG